MGRLKSVLNWFVTIEEEEGDFDEEQEQERAPAPEALHTQESAPSSAEQGGGKSLDDYLAEQEAEGVSEGGGAGQGAFAGMSGRSSSTPSGVRVRDLGLDPYAGELDEAMLAHAPGEMTRHDFTEIYDAAGLPREEDPGFTVFKVEKMLRSEHLQGLSNRAKAASVMVALEAGGAELQVVIQDAVSRDKALDQYEAMSRREIRELQDSIEFENDLIQSEIEEFLELKRQEIAENNARLNEARETFETWTMRKSEEEQRLFDTVSIFVAENPISQGPVPDE